jgi:hypothetical protein
MPTNLHNHVERNGYGGCGAEKGEDEFMGIGERLLTACLILLKSYF